MPGAGGYHTYTFIMYDDDGGDGQSPETGAGEVGRLGRVLPATGGVVRYRFGFGFGAAEKHVPTAQLSDWGLNLFPHITGLPPFRHAVPVSLVRTIACCLPPPQLIGWD